MALSWITAIALFALSSIYCIVSHPNREMWFQDFFPLKVCPANASEKTFYGIMFDAGSTGTRIHIYTFKQKSSGCMAMFQKLTSQPLRMPAIDAGEMSGENASGPQPHSPENSQQLSDSSHESLRQYIDCYIVRKIT